MENRVDSSLGQQLNWEMTPTAGEGQPGWALGPQRVLVEATDSEMLYGSFLPLLHALACPPCKAGGDSSCNTQEG